MKTCIGKWGNSLAVRIPKTLARKLRFHEGAPVTMHAEEDELVIEPVREERFDLDELVGRITEDNQHDAIDFGEPVGKETW